MDDLSNLLRELAAALRRSVDILVQATHAVQRNLPALATYLGITVVASLAGHAVNRAILHGDENPTITAGLMFYEFAINAVLMLVTAFAQAIVFARMGREIDKPLWKVGGDREALRLYFPTWLALNAIVVILYELGYVVPAYFEMEALGVFPQLLLLGAAAFYIPVGASLMFHRKVEWAKIGESLGPLQRQLPKTLLIACFAGGLFLLNHLLAIQTLSEPVVQLLVDIIFGYFDCVIFAAAWLVCIIDRQNPEEMDFEF